MRTLMIAVVLSALLAGCTNSPQRQTEELDQKGARTELLARGTCETVFNAIHGHAQGGQGPLWIANSVVVQGLRHPDGKSAEINVLNTSVGGGLICAIVRISEQPDETCHVCVLSPKTMWDRKQVYAQAVRGWLEQEGLLIEGK